MRDFDTPFSSIGEKLQELTNEECLLIPLTGVMIADCLPKIEELVVEYCGVENILHGFLVDILQEVPRDKNAGFSLCRKLKSGSLTSKAKVICMTSRHFEIDQNEYASCGADGLIERNHNMDFHQFARRIIQDFDLK